MKLKNNEMSSHNKPQLKKIKSHKQITEYRLSSNDLTVLFIQRAGTGVITSDIVYKVGSRDEERGETGIAHMLEHMLFKPTSFDLKRKNESDAMLFEREVGVILNANTWKDRTSYFFSYPKSHFERALRIESERMQHVVLTDKEFLPEQGNVLSEYDMYAGNEEVALSVQMHAVAFLSHPYGHETIGHREDIQAYTPEKLQKFYKRFYTPNNATLIIAGDLSEIEMKTAVLKYFAHLESNSHLQLRKEFSEPKQEGLRTVTVQRSSTTQILGIGMKHEAFPSQAWFETAVCFNLLMGDSDSILNKAFVDTGLATKIDSSLEPTRETNLSEIFITLTSKISHERMQEKFFEIISNLSISEIQPFLKRSITKTLLDEAIQTESGLGLVSSLVEYVSADAWENFYESEKILKKITATDIKKRLQSLCHSKNVIIGYFKGVN